MDRPAPAQYQDLPGPLKATSGQELCAPMPMEVGEIESETDLDPTVLEVPAINWARSVGVKSVKYVKVEHAHKSFGTRREQLGHRADCEKN